MNISVITSVQGLDELRRSWNDLVRASAGASVFVTWEWANSWWRAYGGSKELWILTFEEGGVLIGIAPFYLRSFNHFGLPFIGAYLLGDGSSDSDYLDIIARDGYETAVASALSNVLQQVNRPFHALFLNEIAPTSRMLSLLHAELSRRAWSWAQSEVPCSYVELPRTWDDYLKTLRPRMRTKVRSLTRELEAAHAVRLDRCQRVDELPARLLSLFQTHSLRWREKDQTGVFTTDNKKTLYNEVSRSFLEQDWLRFYSLSVDGAYVAHQFCFEYNGVMFLLQEGFDPAWENDGVGNVLRALVLRDCIERGTKRYDFLGGVTQHKLSWGAHIKNSWRVSAAPRGLRANVLLDLPRAVNSAKSAAKMILPSRVIEWARSISR